MTSAPIDLRMMEEKVKEGIYSAATQFRADLQAMVTACKDGLDADHPVKKSAMYLWPWQNSAWPSMGWAKEEEVQWARTMEGPGVEVVA